MFLAFNELKHEKLRYGLVIAMITLLAYLIFIMTSLALGLANENTDALYSWHVKSGVLNKSADVNLRQSLLTKAQVDALTKGKDNAAMAETSVVLTGKGADKEAVTFVGLRENQFIAKDMELTTGKKVHRKYQVVLDDSLQAKGYKLNQKIRLNSSDHAYTIVGFTHKAKLNIVPVVYGTIPAWQELSQVGPRFAASGVFSKNDSIKTTDKALKSYSLTDIIDKLPGYSAQNTTFYFMIGFLMIISLIIIAVFLYIVTLQKLPNYAVLRAQGVPNRFLINATLAQSFLLTASGVVIALIFITITGYALPESVPMTVDPVITSLVSIGLILMSILGALIPMRMVTKVDPVSVIGG
ncbi:ABC transporter permease [Ligilactobacillus equi]|uniref:Putative hemin transport system permease protein HrtB n=2 Tax=Ligilactobacillus equi TaxID=137357 RepID=V7HYI3_9LACO|nr:ABC transporter permease [Ligilactobacillus equi]ETA74283.1 ABC superfamily ATP binding cassette transporter, membrane protein [Ligilactobacillus equi DPC 6820]KRL75934.1 ABC superfamily ATP binding cassette transporter, membrane protein [Ligilactobacillus equi DSM 15833 = JCM 10991]